MFFNKKKIHHIDGHEIYSITFKNDNNFEINFFNYGGYIHQVKIPYKDNVLEFEDVILGYDNIEDWLIAPGYFNSIIGRVGNRISNSEFMLNNRIYKLSKNMSPHHIHGGTEGFNKKIWNIKKIDKNENELNCELIYFSKDLEEGYPGNLECKVSYTLNNNNEFIIKYRAKSDKDTIVNMTNHNYWNFHGHKNFYKKITDHSVRILSNKYCENDNLSIPTGEIIDTKNTKYNFFNHKIITEDLLISGGIDNNYDFSNNASLKKVAEIFSNLTRMGVIYYTDQLGVQFYTGNMMEKKYNGKQERQYGLHHGLCIEPQNFPDGINQTKFTSPILKAFDEYSSTIIMKLSNDF